MPLYVATMLQGFMLWLPIEKLFMSEIGFDAASVGLMAAAYAAAVPMVEVLSGVLADRWSRRGVLVLSSVALVVSNVIGGISNDVATYIVSAMALGVYFAMFTGTMDAIVYDTVLEETGDSGAFEQRIGRVRLVEGIALVSSSVAGGWVAGITATRVTYFLTIPFAVLSIIAYLRFREPLLHKEGPAKSLRDHLAVTFRTLTRQRMLLPIIALAVLSSLILQVMFEFGPLWMVALAVPPVLYGPYWAGLVSTLGIGGLLAGRLRLDRPAPVAAAVGVMIAAALVLPTPAGVAVVIIAQITLALVMVLASIHVTRLLHDAVPSTVRTGVASGVSALSWIAFLPFALVFGVVSRDHGVRPASWMIIVVTVLAGILLAAVARLFGPSEPAPSGIDRPQERNNLATALRE